MDQLVNALQAIDKRYAAVLMAPGPNETCTHGPWTK